MRQLQMNELLENLRVRIKRGEYLFPLKLRPLLAALEDEMDFRVESVNDRPAPNKRGKLPVPTKTVRIIFN